MHVHLPDAAAAADATDLIDRFGAFAAAEAAARAHASRERGNVVAFCRWRQIARWIGQWHAGPEGATRH